MLLGLFFGTEQGGKGSEFMDSTKMFRKIRVGFILSGKRGVIVSLCLSHYSYRQKGEVLLFWGVKGPTEYIVLTRGESG